MNTDTAARLVFREGEGRAHVIVAPVEGSPPVGAPGTEEFCLEMLDGETARFHFITTHENAGTVETASVHVPAAMLFDLLIQAPWYLDKLKPASGDLAEHIAARSAQLQDPETAARAVVADIYNQPAK